MMRLREGLVSCSIGIIAVACIMALGALLERYVGSILRPHFLPSLMLSVLILSASVTRTLIRVAETNNGSVSPRDPSGPVNAKASSRALLVAQGALEVSIVLGVCIFVVVSYSNPVIHLTFFAMLISSDAVRMLQRNRHNREFLKQFLSVHLSIALY